MTDIDELFAAGDAVQGSGVYLAEHQGGHADPHEITITYGNNFPACAICGAVRFRPVRLAHSAGYYAFFAPTTPH